MDSTTDLSVSKRAMTDVVVLISRHYKVVVPFITTRPIASGGAGAVLHCRISGPLSTPDTNGSLSPTVID